MSLHDPTVMDSFLACIRQGLTRTEAAKALRLGVGNTLKLIREDPVIYEQVREAEDEKFAPVLKSLFKAASAEPDAFGEVNIDAIKEVMAYKKHQDLLDAKKEEARIKAGAQTGTTPMPALILGDDAIAALTKDLERRKALEAGEIIDAESSEE